MNKHLAKKTVSFAISGVLVLSGAFSIVGLQALSPSESGILEQAQAVSASKVKKVLKKKLKSIKKKAPEGKFFFDGVHHKYADIDKDGKVELLVYYGSGAYGQAMNQVYKYKSGKAKKVFEGESRGLAFTKCYPKTKTLVLTVGYKGMMDTYWFKYVNGKYKQKAVKFDASGYTGSVAYEGAKGKTVSKASYKKRVSKLKKGKAKSLGDPWSW